MLRILLLLPLFFLLVGSDTSDLPTGYELQYEQNFDSWEALKDFEMSDPSAWKWDGTEGGSLELFGKSEYRARVRSPFNIALLKDHLFGDFILETRLAQSGREYGHRDLCLFFSAKDPTNFYYVHIASVADDHANNIFLVNDEPRVKIATKTTEGTQWGETNSWHKVRIERKVETGSIKIFFDDMETPIMEATDQHFDIGRIGLGSFDDTGRFDDLRIWAPKVHQPDSRFFQ